jgi:hypothetical protein
MKIIEISKPSECPYRGNFTTCLHPDNDFCNKSGEPDTFPTTCPLKEKEEKD